MEFITMADAKKKTGLSYLGSVNKSSKIAKNGKVSGQHTYSLYLSPYDLSGYNVCSHSTNECRLGCLHTSGHTAIEIFSGKNKIQNSRNKKTRLLIEHPDFFMNWLVTEITNKRKKANEVGMGFSVRLNCTSDVDWKHVKLNGFNIFEIFPDVQFYDYTKNPNKFIGIAPNYHLTFSYTGKNWHACKSVLDRGFNIAVVFNVKHANDLPIMFEGYKVINGDKTDYRVNDGRGVIVGLKWKRIANRENEKMVLNSCFVVNVPQSNVHNLTIETLKTQLLEK